MSGRRPIVILGSGYTGGWIYKLAGRQARSILASSRRPDCRLSSVAPPARLRFDLADPTTWSALPRDADLIWTFPAVPFEQVQAFARHACGPLRRLVVLGSTSAYDTGSNKAVDLPPWLDETAPVDHDLPRVRGEEYLRLHHGAVILRVAGIYGPQRNPVDWIKQGRVGPTDKFVNLIHVEDLAHLCLLAVHTGRAGEVYNVSDGRPRRWRSICEEVARRWGIVGPEETRPNGPGKRILNQKLLTHFDYTLRYPDLYEVLEALQTASLPLG
ncbi:MAG: hypothetical protein OJF47_001872 [Nitrospira sp.]|jgi:nucleoside-diphosphate-sugar epimerase|nr:MAG: hypothetical protein OJF47_001872 [Nitrospira sp.]